jgi:hypothetical protein
VAEGDSRSLTLENRHTGERLTPSAPEAGRRGLAAPVVDLDRYLQAVFEIMNAGPEGRPTLFYMAHAALRHRHTQAVLIMPRPVQAVQFRVLVAVGTVLGHYRGTDGPGCPARCSGAPVCAGEDA